MEIQLKQRLVGLTVIFSLAVIFLPMLLDGSGLTPKPVQISIPPAPHIETNVRVEEKVIELKRETSDLKTLTPVIVDEISDPPDTVQKGDEEAATVSTAAKKPDEKMTRAGIAQTEQKDTLAANQISTEKTSNPAQPAVKKEDVSKPRVGGSLWVIQTGSFRDKNLAYRQRDRIRKSKLSAVFIEKFEINRKLNYRVRMGPFITRKKAEIVRNKVLAKYDMKGIVMQYEK